MTENEFIDAIDFNFPYESFDKASELISQAGEVSQNSIYMVLHEILRAPSFVDLETKKVLYDMWQADYATDPLFPVVEKAALAYLTNAQLQADESCELINNLIPFSNQVYALTLLVFVSNDTDGVVEEAMSNTLSYWQSIIE